MFISWFVASTTLVNKKIFQILLVLNMKSDDQLPFTKAIKFRKLKRELMLLVKGKFQRCLNLTQQSRLKSMSSAVQVRISIMLYINSMYIHAVYIQKKNKKV